MLPIFEKLYLRNKIPKDPKAVEAEKLRELQNTVAEASREAQKKQYDENMERYKREAKEVEVQSENKIE